MPPNTTTNQSTCVEATIIGDTYTEYDETFMFVLDNENDSSLIDQSRMVMFMSILNDDGW